MLVDIDVIGTSPPIQCSTTWRPSKSPTLHVMWGWIWSTTSAYSTCASGERFMKKHQVHVIKVWRMQPTKHKTNISNCCFLGKPNKFLESEWIIFGNSRTISHGHRASLQCWNSMIFVNVCKSAMCKTKLNCPLPVFHWQRSPGWNIERLRILGGIYRYHFCSIGVSCFFVGPSTKIWHVPSFG